MTHLEDSIIYSLQQYKERMVRQLNRELFSDGAPWIGRSPADYRYYMWLHKSSKWTRRYRAVRYYLATLWRAVRGEAIYEPDDD